MLVSPLIPQFFTARLVSCVPRRRAWVMAAQRTQQKLVQQETTECMAQVGAVEPMPKRQRKLWRIASICSGMAVCHRAFDVIVIANPSFHVTHVFACEVAPCARKVLSMDFPNLRLFGNVCEEGARFPDCDVLVAGFPCQPYSSANRHRKGSKDKRSIPVVHAIVEYVQRVKPAIVVLENVPGILSWGRDVLAYITKEFQASGYHMDFRTLAATCTVVCLSGGGVCTSWRFARRPTRWSGRRRFPCGACHLCWRTTSSRPAHGQQLRRQLRRSIKWSCSSHS